MFKPSIQSAAIAVLCLAAAASPAMAKKKVHHYRHAYQQPYEGYGSTNPYPNYTTAATQSLIGRYTSQDFYPNPLVLNITGMDAAGNLQGSMSGMMSKPQNGWDPAYDKWQKVFGRDARAVYRNNQVVVTFNNGATYTLNVNGNQLTGQFADSESRRSMSFYKSQVAPMASGY